MIDNLDSLSVVLSCVQILMGGAVLTIFKIWLLKEDELNKAITLRKENKNEELCEALQYFVDRINSDVTIRGNNGEYPDIALFLTRRIVNVCSELEYLKRCKKQINNLHTFLISASLFGVLFLIIALCIDSHYYIISLTSIAAIVGQVVAFFLIRAKGNKLYEFDNL